jgi:ankyrin repeat protein
MERIEGQVEAQTDLAKEVLSWITFAKRPFTTTELQCALAVEVGETQLDDENIPELEDMVSVCAGLVTVDEQSNIIRLVHYTTQEYFKRKAGYWFPNAESEITKICIIYLSFDAFSCGPCEPYDELEQRLRLNPLYTYAARNWGELARHALSIGQEVVDFLLSKAQVEASSQALIDVLRREGTYPYILSTRPVTGLHLVAFLGLEEGVKALLQTGVDPDQAGMYGRTALTWAAKFGHKAIVKLLLGTGKVDAESIGENGRTPLSWAARYGHKAVVKLLLDTGKVDADSTDKYGQTPFSWATKHGYEATSIVRLLVDSRKADINSYDKVKRTALSYATRNGHENTVGILLSNSSVNPDWKDYFGLTPLSIATRNHRTEIARQLLETGRVDLDSRDCFGRIPVWYARRYGYDDIAKLSWKRQKRVRYHLWSRQLTYGGMFATSRCDDEYCKICTMNLPDGLEYYQCQVCSIGGFHVCLSCYEVGGRTSWSKRMATGNRICHWVDI